MPTIFENFYLSIVRIFVHFYVSIERNLEMILQIRSLREYFPRNGVTYTGTIDEDVFEFFKSGMARLIYYIFESA